MPTDLFVDGGSTTVTSGGTTAPAAGTSESWTVTSTTGFPTAVSGVSQFRVSDPALAGEVMIVTASPSTTWTVTRGAEGTTPVAHTSGFTVQPVFTSGAAVQLQAGFNLATQFNFGGATVVDPAVANTSKQLATSGVLFVAKARAQQSMTVGHVCYTIYAGGASLTAGQSFVGIYDAGQATAGSATLLATSASQSTTWATPGIYQTSMTSPPAITAGADYFVGWMSVGSTMPSLVAASLQSLVNGGLTGANLRYASVGSGNTALPGSFALANMVASNGSVVAILLP